jgi:hypothetical protein
LPSKLDCSIGSHPLSSELQDGSGTWYVLTCDLRGEEAFVVLFPLPSALFNEDSSIKQPRHPTAEYDDDFDRV